MHNSGIVRTFVEVLTNKGKVSQHVDLVEELQPPPSLLVSFEEKREDLYSCKLSSKFAKG